MDFSTTTIDLIRHGEPEGGEKFRGSIDDPLSTLGWSQLNETIGDHQHWHHITSSPLLRCSEFARQVSVETKTPLNINPHFQEVSFGDWEGKKATEIESSSLSLFWSDPIQNPPPNGERLMDFQARVISAWQTLTEIETPPASAPKDRNILLVAHGGTIRIILAHVLQMPLQALFKLQIPYAAISRIAVYHQYQYPHQNKSEDQTPSTEQTANVLFINGCLDHTIEKNGD